ncbi:MAG: hypothetical protein LBU82_00350 [Treponema sp.]|jgi:HEAT repeat protein|nr:hypothetical protein [Treponema sp.]
MKKLVILSVFLGILGGAVIAQETDYNIRSFNDQTTVRGKLKAAQAASKNGSGTVEFYNYAMDWLLRYFPNVEGNAEVKAADDLAILLSAKLGEARYTAAGQNLWRVVENFSNPLARAEALNSLGKVQATAFIPQICKLLNDLNLEGGKDSMQRERVAFGAVLALEGLADRQGYLPVFNASTGWYTERTKKRAREALPKILSNPTEPLLSVIRSSDNFSAKLTALQTLEAADISTQEKAQGAVASLYAAWYTNTNIIADRMILSRTRKLALSMIRRYGTTDSSVYSGLDNSYKRGYDEDEKYAALLALSALGSDEAVGLLSNYLYEMNTRLDRGTLTKSDEHIVRVLIPALGDSRNKAAMASLKTIEQKDWTGAVQKLAQTALNKLQ